MSNPDQKSFSLGYLAAITEWAGADAKSSTRVVFPCIQGTRAVMAGSGVPLAVTNNEVVAKADALLQDGNAWYVPNAKQSYSDSLSRYFDYVVLKAGSKAAEDQLTAAQADLTAATNAYNTLDEAAWDKWNASLRFKGKTYEDYLTSQRPDVVQAKAKMDDKAEEVAQAIIASGIPGAEKIKAIKENMRAITKREKLTGVTMPIVSNAQVMNASYYIDRIVNGQAQTVAEPTDVTYSAAYDLDPGYRQIMDRWFKEFPNAQYKTSISIKETSASDETLKQSGHDTKTVEASAGLFGWFRVSYQETTNWEKSSTTSASGSFKVTILCKEKQVFDIRPAKSWNVPGYRTAYPYVRDDCPAALKNLVQPVSMLCASGLKIRIEFSGDKRTSFDAEYAKAQGAGGSISIFGFSFAAGAAKDIDKTNTHKGTWDSTNGVLEVEPTAYEGNCTLLAIIGERFEN